MFYQTNYYLNKNRSTYSTSQSQRNLQSKSTNRTISISQKNLKDVKMKIQETLEESTVQEKWQFFPQKNERKQVNKTKGISQLQKISQNEKQLMEFRIQKKPQFPKLRSMKQCRVKSFYQGNSKSIENHYLKNFAPDEQSEILTHNSSVYTIHEQKLDNLYDLTKDIQNKLQRQKKNGGLSPWKKVREVQNLVKANNEIYKINQNKLHKKK